jgi:hypothetical protein
MFSDRDRTCRANHGNTETPPDEFKMVSDRIIDSRLALWSSGTARSFHSDKLPPYQSQHSFISNLYCATGGPIPFHHTWSIPTT